MKKQIIPLFACLLAIHPALLSAQPAQPSSETPESISKTETRFDLDFPGRTIADLIEQISQAIGQPAPVIASIDARELPIPPIKLLSTTVDQVLWALHSILSNDPSFQIPGGSSPRVIVPQTKGALWVITYHQPLPSVQITRVFQISPLLESLQLQDITTAIETAWQISGTSGDTKIRFHKETKLLFIRGNSDQVKLVEQILQELHPRDPTEVAKENASVSPMEALAEEIRQRREHRRQSVETGEPRNSSAPTSP